MNGVLLFLFIAGILGLVYPKILRCQTRMLPFALLVGVIATVTSMGIAEKIAAQEARWATLKVENPAQYLEELRDTNEGRWLNELAELDPKQHKVEVARIEREAVEQKEWEKEMRELAKQEAIEAPKKKLCKSSTAKTLAYVMMIQPAIEKRLKSPASADFPNLTSIQSGYVGECSFVFAGYVDAQNGLGAIIRTKYEAKATRDPEREDMWKIDFVNIL